MQIQYLNTHALEPCTPPTHYLQGYGNLKTGARNTMEFSMYLTRNGGAQLSYWHDIPLDVEALDTKHVVPLVVEIPTGCVCAAARCRAGLLCHLSPSPCPPPPAPHCRTVAKMEINKEVPWNPIKQDTKNGKLRDYPMASVVHYGAIPRTYEHPDAEDELTGLIGDGDPVDAVEISEMAVASGSILRVKVLGALAMEDDDAADWKIITLRLDDPMAASVNGEWCRASPDSFPFAFPTLTLPTSQPHNCADLADIMSVKHVRVERTADGGKQRHVTSTPEQPKANLGRAQLRILDKLDRMRNFFRDYKKKSPTDPSPVKFAYDASYLDAATAVDVLRHHHIHWCNTVDAAVNGVRVGMQSPQIQKYRDACNEARAAWRVELDAAEAPGAATGTPIAKVPEGVWLPVGAT